MKPCHIMHPDVNWPNGWEGGYLAQVKILRQWI